MKAQIRSFIIKASFALNAVVIMAALVAFFAVKTNAAEGYMKLSTSFGRATIDKVEIAQTDPELAMQAMPLPQRKPKVP